MNKEAIRELLQSAEKIVFYNDETIYLEPQTGDDVYGLSAGRREWFLKENYWDYYESELMMSYLRDITVDEAMTIIEKWEQDHLAETLKLNAKLEKAICFATEKHAGQLRKGTTLPYILHPLETMQILRSMNADTNLLIAGLLHDTVEDTDATVAEIKKHFGADVANLVGAHSEDKSKTWEERKLHAIQELAVADKRLKMLVMADKVANLRSIAADYRALGDKLWDRFNAPREKQSWYYSGIQDSLIDMHADPNTRNVYWEMVALFKDVFVSFYKSQSQSFLLQVATGEAYRLDKGNSVWIPVKNYENMLEECVQISRAEAEYIEDNWHQSEVQHEQLLQ